MKRPLNRIERMRSILKSIGSKAAAQYAAKHGLSIEAAILVVRGAGHA